VFPTLLGEAREQRRPPKVRDIVAVRTSFVKAIMEAEMLGGVMPQHASSIKVCGKHQYMISQCTNRASNPKSSGRTGKC
jgi:hypothetical protein